MSSYFPDVLHVNMTGVVCSAARVKRRDQRRNKRKNRKPVVRPCCEILTRVATRTWRISVWNRGVICRLRQRREWSVIYLNFHLKYAICPNLFASRHSDIFIRMFAWPSLHVEQQRSENVRRLKKYLSEQQAHDLANQASEILDLHRGKEKMLFKKLVNEFGGVLTYCSGTKSKRKKKRSGKSRTRQKDKSSTLNSSKEKTTFNRSVIVPTS